MVSRNPVLRNNNQIKPAELQTQQQNKIDAARVQQQILAQNSITILRAKITEYENARDAVQAVQSACNVSIDTWQTTQFSLATNSEDIKKVDVFEGEMAEALESAVKNGLGQINDGITSGRMLSGVLSSQIVTINNRIAQLQAEIVNWSKML